MVGGEIMKRLAETTTRKTGTNRIDEIAVNRKYTTESKAEISRQVAAAVSAGLKKTEP